MTFASSVPDFRFSNFLKGLFVICGKYKATPIRVGLRVGAVCGPGGLPENRAGTVVSTETTGWGTRWKVEMDDSSIEWISAMQTNEVGIGWYSIGESA
ncbi:hypothetical protein G3N57_00750 [Paraburkholderia sp. Se-20369]|nr:hypothetical protein [Paraburkholderia sp. Se-20369]